MNKLITVLALTVSLGGCASYQEMVQEAELNAELNAAAANQACGFDTRKFNRAIVVGRTTEDCFTRTLGYKYEKTVYSSGFGIVNSYWLDDDIIKAKDSYFKMPTDAYKPRHVTFVDGIAATISFGE